MNKFKIANTIIALFTVVIIALAFSSVEKPTMEPITDFTEVELAKNETLRLEYLFPIGKTSDGKGTIFADANSEMWILNNFYAEENDVFVALMNDKGTKDKTDDVIVDIWLDLE
jgi:hypothetical protein